MVKISQAQTPVGSIHGGVPLSRVITNPDDYDDGLYTDGHKFAPTGYFHACL